MPQNFAIIQQQRVRNLEKHLGFLERGTTVILGIVDVTRFASRLLEIGFVGQQQLGQQILPSSRGPVSRFNANGKEVVHRDLPKETRDRVIEWTWFERHGTDKVEKTDWKTISYERYSRTLIPPPSVELRIVQTPEGMALLAPAMIYGDNNDQQVLHTLNLILELFGECHILTESLERIVWPELISKNWEFLPAGEYPWSRVKQEFESVIARAKKGNRAFLASRFETIHGYGPEFWARGLSGFAGYVTFGFPRLGLYVVESAVYGNATYVLGEDWEVISKLSKAEIINENRHLERLVHTTSWHEEVRKMMERAEGASLQQAADD